MRVVTDRERRVRAAIGTIHDPSMLNLLQRHYGAGSVELREPSRQSTAARTGLAYFDGDLNAVDELATETQAVRLFQRAVWSALRETSAGRTLSYGRAGGSGSGTLKRSAR